MSSSPVHTPNGHGREFCHMRKHAIILAGATALRAVRRERRISGEVSWIPVEAHKQPEVLNHATCLNSLIDLDDFRRMGILDDGGFLEVAVAPCARRSAARPVHVRAISSLGEGALMRISEGIYSLSPAALMLDLAPSMAFEELLGLAEELCGCWSLPDCRLEPDEIEESLDFLGKPCGYFECKPALTIEELERYRTGAARAHGRNAAETVAHHAVGGSRSPMEAIMNCMFALPHSYGGFGCGHVKPNCKIKMDATAQILSGLPYILADAYLPKLNAILEYNGSYHDEACVRRRDEARTLGLMSMGIDVYRLNSDQLRDVDALESVARMMYKRAGRYFRPRAASYQEKRVTLLAELRKALGLDRELEPARLRISEQMTIFQDM